MNTYEFEATDFGISPEGIHLLRSRYNYKIIGYQEIDKATVKRAGEFKNPLLSLVLGIILAGFAILQVIYLFQRFNDPHVRVIYIELIILPILPGFIGGYFLYIATKTGPVLVIEAGNKKYKLRLRDFTGDNKINDLINYLSGKLSYKFSVQMSYNK